MQITARLPVLEVTEPNGTSYFATITLGAPLPGTGFGEEVRVKSLWDREEFPSLFVAAVDTVPASAVVPEVLAMFGFAETLHLVAALEREYGTGLPRDPQVTVYTLYDRPVEDLAAAFDEEVG